MKLSTTSGLKVADYFAPSDTGQESAEDKDLGSGGAILLPDMKDKNGKTWHLAVGGGKPAELYVVDRDAMGKFDPTKDNVYQAIPFAGPGAFHATPAYFNNAVYIGAVGSHLRSYKISNARLVTPFSSQTGTLFPYPGATPSISANGKTNGIVWAAENATTAVLHAYDATDLSKELYNSTQAGTRDSFGTGNKFITPTIANGKVFVGTTNGVGVFGLLP
jgi:outer membrane protein assembly factor BamB